MTVIAAEGISKRFGEIVVADDLGFSVDSGRCLGIIGPNGAGKTSVFNIIDGTLRADAGRVFLNGRDVSSVPKYRRVRYGMARAYQVPQPFPDLTTFENVLVAATFGSQGSQRRTRSDASDLLCRTGLHTKGDTAAGSLGLLDRKRLELARALAARPKLLLLDEIAGGLTQMEVDQLVELINTIKPEVATIWIEHVTHALSAVADEIVAIHFGRKIAEGKPAEVLKNPQVQEVYMGTVL